MSRRDGGLIVKLGGACRFIPASVAITVLARPVISRVPGASFGMMLFSGRVVPVIELGDDRRQIVICDLGDEALALSGLEVCRAGFFDVDERGAAFDGSRAPLLDVAAEARAVRARLSGALA